jgi:hypothetical protein
VLLTASNGVREISGRRVPPDSGAFFYEERRLQLSSSGRFLLDLLAFFWIFWGVQLDLHVVFLRFSSQDSSHASTLRGDL